MKFARAVLTDYGRGRQMLALYERALPAGLHPCEPNVSASNQRVISIEPSGKRPFSADIDVTQDAQVLVALHDRGSRRNLRNVRLALRFSELSATHRRMTGRIRLRAPGLAVGGMVRGSWCAVARGDPTRAPSVNGVAWNPDRVPDELPRRRVGAVLGGRPFVPTRVTLAKRYSDDEGWELGFFRAPAAQPCRKKRSSEEGFSVFTGHRRLRAGARFRVRPTLLATAPGAMFAGLTARAGAEYRNSNASLVFLQIESLSETAMTGRIYMVFTTRERELLVGSFRAEICASR